MAETFRNDSADDIRLAAELMETAGASKDQLRDSDARSDAAIDAASHDATLGAVHFGEQEADEHTAGAARGAGDFASDGRDSGLDGFRVDRAGDGESAENAGAPAVHESSVPDIGPLEQDASRGASVPGHQLRVPAAETEAAPLRVAARLMSDDDGEFGSATPFAATTDQVTQDDAPLFGSPIDATAANAASGTENADTSVSHADAGAGGQGPAAMAPTLTANDVSGDEDGAIALDIASALSVGDGSGTLSITIAGVPAGASLSAGSDDGDGVWTLTQAELADLTLTPPAGSDANFTLTVTSTVSDVGGGAAQSVDTFDVAVYDVIEGTEGDDSIAGADHEDAIHGLDGDDFLKGLGGNDDLYGGDGDDVLWGQGGDDVLYGGTGADELLGHGGDDTLEGGRGRDDLDGGGGTDTISYAGSRAGVTVDLGAGTARGGDAQGDVFANFENLTGSEHDDTLTGDGGDNVLAGGAGDDALFGGAGDDTLIGGAGDDTSWGGDGGDIYVFMEVMGNDTFHGGAGNWTDIVQLQDAAGNAPTDGWSFTLTQGEVVTTAEDYIELSQDAAGVIAMDDGSTLTFDGVEKFIW